MRSDYEDRLPLTDADEQTPPAPASTPLGEIQDAASSTPDIVEDVLIEEVSIDGMCGVY